MSTPGATAPIQKYKNLAHRVSMIYAHSRNVGILCSHFCDSVYWFFDVLRQPR